VSESAVSPAPSAKRAGLLAVPAVTGIAYTASWIAGLSLGAPSPGLNASGAEIVTAFAGHESVTAAGFILTEGLPAAGLAVISCTWPAPHADPQRRSSLGSPVCSRRPSP
jgi:hypothetical protein